MHIGAVIFNTQVFAMAKKKRSSKFKKYGPTVALILFVIIIIIWLVITFIESSPSKPKKRMGLVKFTVQSSLQT